MIPLTALALSVIMISVAFAVDLGRQRTERRDMQAIADMVSMDLTRQIAGRDAGTVRSDPAFLAALMDSSARNGHSNPTVPCPTDDIVGRCVSYALGSVDASHAFIDCGVDPSCMPTAVQVTAGADVEYFFQPGSGDTRRVAVARVADNQQAYFKVGSSLLSLNPASRTIVSRIIGQVVPEANVLSYEGLLAADIRVDRLRQKLGIPVTVASPQELLDTTVTLRRLTVAAIEVLTEDGGDLATIAALNGFRERDLPGDELSFGRLIGVDLGGGSPAGSAEVNFLQMITAGAFLIDGEHFVNVPGSELGVPGIAGLDIRLTGVEAPRIGGPNHGDSVTTSQVDVEITPYLDIDEADTQQICDLQPTERNRLDALIPGIINRVLGALGCLLPPPPTPISVSISGAPTISLEMAQVQVEQTIDCASRTLTLTSTPAVLDLKNDFDISVNVDVDGVPIPGEIARLVFGAGARNQGSPETRSFVGVDPGTPLPTGTLYDQFNPPEASLGTVPFGLSGLLNFDDAQITFMERGFELPGLANRAVNVVTRRGLDPVMVQLDNQVLQPLTKFLGLRLGGADLTPLSLQCDESAVLLVV
ncbi:MAG TPA: hypothetical protein VLN74_07325 [Ilumatobacteraceae bacterium]|nr:hypothetical protein [Ilumatobacteraceae bacterium]